MRKLSALVDWRSRAACRDADPELFFPGGSAGPALLAVDRAKHLCEACPVQARCLDWALDHHAAFGIWGGLTEGELRALRQALTRMPCQRGSQHAGPAEAHRLGPQGHGSPEGAAFHGVPRGGQVPRHDSSRQDTPGGPARVSPWRDRSGNRQV